jgi:alginate O-acetyltransferase complex protein AlgI
LFTHLFFWGFFLIVATVYSFIYKLNKLRIVYLLLVSLFFYYKTSGVFLLLLLFTICSDFYWGNKISKSQIDTKRKWYLSTSVIINLSVLCYFKYAYFFVDSVNQIAGTHLKYFNHFASFSNTWFSSSFSVDKLLLPVGVSFFTFQSLSYVFDVYRNKINPVKSISDYGFFVCFFPHLVAGPIVKAHDFIHQIYQPYTLTKHEFGMSIFWILNGFCKKIVADYLAVNFIDRIFDNPNYYSGLETLIGIFGYSLQIYMDFSGYTDMAIGIALLFGFRLKTNFLSPYKASNTSDFWKRWHISLSSWLQEYLYFPLGGNRNGTLGSYFAISVIAVFLVLLSGSFWLFISLLLLACLLITLHYFFPSFRTGFNTNINLMVTMLLGGLWHGSSWLFLIWGGLNGIGLIAHKQWQKYFPKKNENSVYKMSMILMTLSFISFTRIFFRSENLQTVNLIFDRLQHHFGVELFFKICMAYKSVFLLIGIGYLFHWLPEAWKIKYRNWFAAQSYTTMILSCIVVIFVTYQLMGSQMQPFIYFQF